jgi:hypothetical protein
VGELDLQAPDPGRIRRVTAPQIVVAAPDGPPVHLLLVTEWPDSTSLHLAWPWLSTDVHASLRQAYRLEDAAGRSLPLLDSRVMPLAGRMNEVTYFDTSGLDHAQTLDLRLRCRLALPVEVPFGG